MNLYFQPGDPASFIPAEQNPGAHGLQMLAVSLEPPPPPETPPSPWLIYTKGAGLKLIDLDTPIGRESMAAVANAVPLYRVALELLVDSILTDAQADSARMRGVRQAFAPEDPPEPVTDSMSQKYAFEGVLKFPILASRSDLQLIELYLRLFGAATPKHRHAHAHIAALFAGSPDKLARFCDGILWRSAGWARLDHVVYQAQRVDHDPEIGFESYVSRGRAAAESMAVDSREALLASWIQAERVQHRLCRDIDAVLRLPDIRRLPRWVRADVFRILEREAMKQVFAEGLARHFESWSELRRCPPLAEPIAANAQGEVAPLIQQLLNQTLSADARYAGSAAQFALAAERRRAEATRLIDGE